MPAGAVSSQDAHHFAVTAGVLDVGHHDVEQVIVDIAPET